MYGQQSCFGLNADEFWDARELPLSGFLFLMGRYEIPHQLAHIVSKVKSWSQREVGYNVCMRTFPLPRTNSSKSGKQKEVDRLVQLREALGFTQRDLAVEFMVTHGAVGLWERGERTIPGPVLKLIGIYEERIKEGKLKKKI
jgi:DNA-binding transcriptional regulator YiaG